MITRRKLIQSAAAGLAVSTIGAPHILQAQSWFREYPFKLGVAAGDPSSDGFVIWTRIAPEPFEQHAGAPSSALPVQWEVAEDDRFRNVVAKGEALARPELGHSVHVELAGLKSDRPYWYRFVVGSDRSLTGRARTLPAAGASVDRLRFGVCGCQHYESGYYTAYRELAQDDDLAFVYHYGDFIYEYAYDYNYGPKRLPVPKVREHRLRELYSVDDYREHYAQYLLDLDLQAARSAHAVVPTFDDHEVQNNWVQDFSQDPSVPPEIFALRRQAAMQAWYENMPVRRSMIPNGPLILANRQLTFGSLAAINVLDTRSFRSNQPCDDRWGVTPCEGVYDKDAQVLGQAQERWLDDNLMRSDTRWNGIAQQVMMMPLNRRTYDDQPERAYNLDSWAGYDVPRKRLMKRLENVPNAVVLTGDEHQNYAGLLLSGDTPVAAECVVTSITSGGDGQDQRPGSDRILANNPQLQFINDQRGYGVCDVTAEAWRTDFMVLDKVSTPGGTLSKRASAVVEAGPANLTIA
ncbi:alkaline phosphatase D family protein [Pseudoblastomonas halimionae]|uniref:Alkaline phosphatase n=1 Tax=Alteriqipengyuania halimionae TaxID=1926630 RepID=A0A6I4U3T7_9SPHN|nr:alkaline phosphatase D family protein [Alteriqipengyuania halimionae]MXP09583.1 alkaline phosphatase [Alteriqipengyuania halimionae]